MTHIIIDRRKNDKGKSTVNRQRYVRRVKEQVREAVKDTIKDGKIGDITTDKGKRVKIAGKGLKQPSFKHDRKGGKQERVFPGNKEFTQGDRIKRPPEGGGKGGGNGASPDGEGEDSFEFGLTRDEFLDIFFEDLELPDLVKKEITKIDEWVNRRAGFSVDGNPSRLNVVRSLRQSKTRRLALRSPKKKKIKLLEEELANLLLAPNPNVERMNEIKDEIEKLKKRIKAVPFIDDIDLRYNRWEKVPIPSTQAVMFAIMDVSGSMGDWEKEMAKRFFMFLYLFLFRNYERVVIKYIRHHTIAKEVDEDEFFYSRETGGTLVSTSIELMKEIIDKRFNPQQWNIYVCQASDGDNWPQDSDVTVDLLRKLLPHIQYYAYVEIDKRGGKDSDIWPYYEKLENEFDNFAMNVITDPTDIFPVFQQLFERKGARTSE